MVNPVNDTPAATAPVEKKTVVGTVVTLVAAIVLAILNSTQANSDLLGNLNPTVQALLIVVIPTLIQFVSQYVTPYTPRDDLAARREARKKGIKITRVSDAA